MAQRQQRECYANLNDVLFLSQASCCEGGEVETINALIHISTSLYFPPYLRLGSNEMSALAKYKPDFYAKDTFRLLFELVPLQWQIRAFYWRWRQGKRCDADPTGFSGKRQRNPGDLFISFAISFPCVNKSNQSLAAGVPLPFWVISLRTCNPNIIRIARQSVKLRLSPAISKNHSRNRFWSFGGKDILARSSVPPPANVELEE